MISIRNKNTVRYPTSSDRSICLKDLSPTKKYIFSKLPSSAEGEMGERQQWGHGFDNIIIDGDVRVLSGYVLCAPSGPLQAMAA